MALPIESMVSGLPQMFMYMQIFAYAVMILFLGEVAMRGWRGFLPFHWKWMGRIGTGFVCLIFGIAMGEYLPYLSVGLLRLIQSHIAVGGFFGGVAIAIGLYLISFRSPGVLEGYRKQIEKFHQKINNMRGKKPIRMLTIIGVVIIVIVMVLAAINFRGFPGDMSEEIFKPGVLPEGMLPEGVTLGSGMMSQECLDLTSVISSGQELTNPQTYDNPTLKAAIESETGSTVMAMTSVNADGQLIILSLMENGQNCFSTEEKLCGCSAGAP